MFTGIIQKLGRVRSQSQFKGGGRLVVEYAPWDRPVELGESVAVMGVCLTVAEQGHGLLAFDVLDETFRRTNLRDQVEGKLVNLERALRFGDPMGGHIVQGHVDGTGTVRRIEQAGRDWVFELGCPASILDEMVYKGSIGLDGISLTVAEVLEDGFTVHIIPHTFEETHMQGLKPGDRVNLETDVFAKYVRRLVERGRLPRSLSWEELAAVD